MNNQLLFPESVPWKIALPKVMIQRYDSTEKIQTQLLFCYCLKLDRELLE